MDETKWKGIGPTSGPQDYKLGKGFKMKTTPITLVKVVGGG
jgi:hypothetical protein